ncbi:MAG: hypothetical protein H6816_11505, partial [Phycisphaerales bacterium]|nr:hypothetical protein [Phycisphaerales bacterium]
MPIPETSGHPRAALSTARRAGFVVVAALMLATASTARASDINWVAMFGGAYNAAANWNGGVPGSSDIAHFTITSSPFTQASYTVDFDVNPANQAIKVEDDHVTFDLNGHNYTLNSTPTFPYPSNDIGTVSTRSGRLTITDGTVTVHNSDTLIGTAPFAAGILTVSTGGQLSFPSSAIISAGYGGNGTLKVINGGRVLGTVAIVVGDEPASTGTLLVSGAGSKLNCTNFYVGGIGNGTATISAGGVVQSSASATDRIAEAGDGTVTVDGPGSHWICPTPLLVGNYGAATLNITNGGRVDDTDCDVALVAGSSANITVSGAGAQWIHSEGLALGHDGAATMNILSGGYVENAQDAYAGQGHSSPYPGSCVVTIDGTDSQWNNLFNLYIGQRVDGTVTVANGGSLDVARMMYVGLLGGTGTLNVDTDGSVFASDGITQGFAGTSGFNINGGLVRTLGPMTVGAAGKATLVQHGGEISIVENSLNIGQDSGGDGYALLDGDGIIGAETLYVGGSSAGPGGMGRLDIAGGTLTISTTACIWDTPGTLVQLSGGTLNVGTLDTKGNPAHFQWTGGTLNLDNPGGLAVGAFGTLGEFVTLSPSSNLMTPVLEINSDGEVALAGGSVTVDTFTNNGVLTMTSGKLDT